MNIIKDINLYYDKELNFSRLTSYEIELLNNSCKREIVDEILFENYLISKSIKMVKRKISNLH